MFLYLWLQKVKRFLLKEKQVCMPEVVASSFLLVHHLPRTWIRKLRGTTKKQV